LETGQVSVQAERFSRSWSESRRWLSERRMCSSETKSCW
jgi:hypothetical protein